MQDEKGNDAYQISESLLIRKTFFFLNAPAGRYHLYLIGKNQVTCHPCYGGGESKKKKKLKLNRQLAMRSFETLLSLLNNAKFHLRIQNKKKV